MIFLYIIFTFIYNVLSAFCISRAAKRLHFVPLFPRICYKERPAVKPADKQALPVSPVCKVAFPLALCAAFPLIAFLLCVFCLPSSNSAPLCSVSYSAYLVWRTLFGVLCSAQEGAGSCHLKNSAKKLPAIAQIAVNRQLFLLNFLQQPPAERIIFLLV